MSGYGLDTYPVKFDSPLLVPAMKESDYCFAMALLEWKELNDLSFPLDNMAFEPDNSDLGGYIAALHKKYPLLMRIWIRDTEQFMAFLARLYEKYEEGWVLTSEKSPKTVFNKYQMEYLKDFYETYKAGSVRIKGLRGLQNLLALRNFERVIDHFRIEMLDGFSGSEFDEDVFEKLQKKKSRNLLDDFENITPAQFDEVFLEFHDYKNVQRLKPKNWRAYKYADTCEAESGDMNWQFPDNEKFIGESSLHKRGYQVGHSSCLGAKERRKIIKLTILMQEMDKQEILSHLSRNIYRNRQREGWELAVKEWLDDLNWLKEQDL